MYKRKKDPKFPGKHFINATNNRKRGKMTQSPNQLKNLIPFDKLSPSERTVIAKKGAEASNKTQALSRMIAKIVDSMAKHKVTETEKAMLAKVFPDLPEDEVNKSAMLIGSLFNQGIIKGNTKAAEMLLRLMGVLKDQRELSGSIVTQKVFVTQGQQIAVDKHIEEVIADDGKSE